MNKTGLIVLVALLLLLQVGVVSALTASEAKQEWLDAKHESSEAHKVHRSAKIDWAADKTEENNQIVIDTGKDLLNAALDEAEAWLIWRDLEVEENQEVPSDLKQTIHEDVVTNLDKIDVLRGEVDGVETKFELGIVFLKMIGKYFELVADVARNTGLIWVHIGNTRADTVADYEAELREEAESMSDNSEILEKLDMARDELETARTNINNAEAEYGQVKLPGTPLIKFSNGNNYLRIARGNLLSAHGYLNQAYNLMVVSDG